MKVKNLKKKIGRLLILTAGMVLGYEGGQIGHTQYRQIVVWAGLSLILFWQYVLSTPKKGESMQ